MAPKQQTHTCMHAQRLKEKNCSEAKKKRNNNNSTQKHEQHLQAKNTNCAEIVWAD